MSLSCTAPATSGSRTGRSRRSSQPTDAIIRLAASCICGSDLWPYWGVEPLDQPRRMGHEYAGIVEEVGSAVTTVKPGQFVVGSFFASDNTCEICRAGYHSSCIHREAAAPDGAQAERMRVPLADGTLVATPDLPRRPGPQPARRVRRAGHRLVRRRRRPGRTGQDRGGGRGRRGRAARHPRGQAARRRTDHRHEPAPAAADSSRSSTERPTSSKSAATPASSG